MTTSLTVNSLIDHLKDDHDMTMAAINEWVREQKHALLTDDTWLTLLMRLHTGLPTVNNCLTWGEDKNG